MTVCRFQKINHLIGTWELGRKDRLYNNVQRLERAKGLKSNIVPEFYVLPRDRARLKIDMVHHPDYFYIKKPLASSRGRGIEIVKHLDGIHPSKTCIVQRYIHNPLTINGYKIDIRLYVGVTSLNPLRVYMYEEGLVRFATDPYACRKVGTRPRSSEKYSASFQPCEQLTCSNIPTNMYMEPVIEG